ncbi:MAG TPA: hypothetical protein VKD88_04130 [Gaiellaceae bacterium]|nr:hypothetical protein [Gaiellaceae bacterium]
MAEPRATARIAEPLDIEPGYRLAAMGREAAEDERLSLLEARGAKAELPETCQSTSRETAVLRLK